MENGTKIQLKVTNGNWTNITLPQGLICGKNWPMILFYHKCLEKMIEYRLQDSGVVKNG